MDEPKKALAMRGQRNKVVAIYYEDGEEIVRAELPNKEWVGLMDEEIEDLFMENMYCDNLVDFEHIARAIEAKLKEKNT